MFGRPYRGNGPAAHEVDWSKAKMPKGSAIVPPRREVEATHERGQLVVKLECDEETLYRVSEDVAAELRNMTAREAALRERLGAVRDHAGPHVYEIGAIVSVSLADGKR